MTCRGSHESDLRSIHAKIRFPRRSVRWIGVLGLTWLAVACGEAQRGSDRPSGVSVAGVEVTARDGAAFGERVEGSVQLRSIALRVHHLDSMVGFYQEAFGVEFRTVDTFGISSRFGEFAGLTLKLVPIRLEDDFVDFPDVQFGLEVPDIEVVIEIAERHGGRAEGALRREAGVLHGAVRDPDGNTIELYQAAPTTSAM